MCIVDVLERGHLNLKPYNSLLYITGSDTHVSVLNDELMSLTDTNTCILYISSEIKKQNNAHMTNKQINMFVSKLQWVVAIAKIWKPA